MKIPLNNCIRHPEPFHCRVLCVLNCADDVPGDVYYGVAGYICFAHETFGARAFVPKCLAGSEF